MKRFEPLVAVTRQLQSEILERLSDSTTVGEWQPVWQHYQDRTGYRSPTAFADDIALATACANVVLSSTHADRFSKVALTWLFDHTDPLLRVVLNSRLLLNDPGPALIRQLDSFQDIRCHLDREQADRLLAAVVKRPNVEPFDEGVGPKRTASMSTELMSFYEFFLQRYNGRQRKRQGVYFTPPSIASFIIRSVDQLLKDEFGLDEGLADGRPWPTARGAGASPAQHTDAGSPEAVTCLLDPALGTGVFLLKAFDLVHHRFQQRVADRPANDRPEWSAFVSDVLLPRLCGLERSAAPLLLAHLQLVDRLAGTGYDFPRGGPLRWKLANALCPEGAGMMAGEPGLPRPNVIVGNPPFSGVSENDHPWIRQLLRGNCRSLGRPVSDYFQVDGQPLRERKHWLEDDYVKFFRLGHWLVEQSEGGILAFVSNHAFLDNVTFRGMRQQLLKTFSRRMLIDLHGNKRNADQRAVEEQTPDERRTSCAKKSRNAPADENVFAIEQGVAISLLRRPVEPLDEVTRYVELWGSRISKLERLESGRNDSLGGRTISPGSPHYLFRPRGGLRVKEYEKAALLPDLMPIGSTAAVTARDDLVVAFSDVELIARMEQFFDPSVSDDHIRSRFFKRQRSSRHAPGDTRGWSLSEVRRDLTAKSNWRESIRSFFYRPFDRRLIVWMPDLIDWPRSQTMDHMTAGSNLALIARRQFPHNSSTNYFWVTEGVVVDGLIRSDNRGSESFFPLNVCSPDRGSGELWPDDPSAINFSTDVWDQVGPILQATQSSAAEGVPRGRQAFEILACLYATLQAPSYQARFAELLASGFPRVFWPRSARLLAALSRLGRQLIDVHLMRAPYEGDGADWRGTNHCVAARFPKFEDDRIRLNESTSIGPVSADVWSYRVGSYQVCRKWLCSRRHRPLDEQQQSAYRHTLSAVSRTIELRAVIDETIRAHGGWPEAFQPAVGQGKSVSYGQGCP